MGCMIEKGYPPPPPERGEGKREDGGMGGWGDGEMEGCYENGQGFIISEVGARNMFG